MTREERERWVASDNWESRLAVAAHHNTPPETLLRLAHDGKEKVRDAAREQLERRGLDWNLEGEARQALLRWLAEHKDDGNRQRAAEAPDCPPEILFKLAGDSVWWVREAMARNPHAPDDALLRLAHDGDGDVRDAARDQLKKRGLGWNLEGEAHKDLLRWLAGHKAGENRDEAAAAPDCPSELLAKLAGDEGWGVRRAVARNINTPSELLVNLAEDDDWEVRAAVARNTNIPSAALEQLSGDEDEAVRAAAREQLEQRQREAACAEYEAGLEAGGMGYGDRL